MAALGSKDGREIVRELSMRFTPRNGSAGDEDGRYVLKTNGK